MAVLDLVLSSFFKINSLTKLNQKADTGKFDAASFRQFEAPIDESIKLIIRKWIRK